MGDSPFQCVGVERVPRLLGEKRGGEPVRAQRLGALLRACVLDRVAQRVGVAALDGGEFRVGRVRAGALALDVTRRAGNERARRRRDDERAKRAAREWKRPAHAHAPGPKPAST
ncbi:hypothetical protein CWD92_30530 [Burkholderia thailandensis]|nr:hypothetical protein A8H32_27675 [Burkholderia thailandensis]PJO68780.1 hypothetical protein CWD92_30530 [Burkholderia thailandensis]